MGSAQSKRRHKESKYALCQAQKAAAAGAVLDDTASATNSVTSSPRLQKLSLSNRAGLRPHRSSSHDRLSHQTIKNRQPIPSPSSTTQRPAIEQRQQQQLEYTGLQSNSAFLPKDWDAQDRHYALHFAVKQLFGDNTLSAVSPKLIKGARIVDIGCVNGAWIMDMASQYPECQFIGIDGSTEMSPDSLPLPNVQFETTADLQALPLDDDSVDLVHMRVLSLRTMKSSWLQTLREAHRVLKPGGVIQLVDLHNVPTGTVLIESFIETMRAILNTENEDFDIILKLPAIMQQAGFQIVQSKKKKIHFKSDGKLGEEFIAIMLRVYETSHLFLAPRMGLDPDEYRLRVEMVCAQSVKHNAHVDWYAYAAKKV
ncbi:hypothetical protein DFQ28_006462 [Apophysomyces sp. BC1034]|nr:hypothetical protein DFQ30_004311 [Apophysomyces sp. BC1015]KAG0182479.1 hypothetical protein DFQ29_003908 [Apophysomyces sp. BC1021]KAG0193087.1 hypothetical protein DFQ28_006462 [Apophysomyces sp. BC1034]